MDTTVLINLLVSLVIAGGGVGGTIYATQQSRRTQVHAQVSTDQNVDRDQLQEDLKELRGEFDRHVTRTNAREARDDRKIRYLEQVVRMQDDEINELRKLMTDAGIAPPARRQWPTYPGDWVEDRT